MKRRHRPRDHVQVLDVDEVQEVVRAAKAEGPFEHALIATMYHFGLRAGEPGRLRRDRLDLGRQDIFIEAEKGSTSGRQSFADSPVDLGTVLRRWLAVHPGGPWLFPAKSTKAKGVHRSVVWTIFRKVAVAAGLSHRAAYPHILKRSIATNLLDAGAPLTYVQNHVRHVSEATTRGYLKLTKRARGEGQAALRAIGDEMRKGEPQR